MSVEGEIKSLIESLQAMVAKDGFAPFIDKIVFPRYRNISPGVAIEFAFPLTVLVGQNGCGKTAVLQAMFGAPEGQSVRTWWFETYVDPIDEPSAEFIKGKRRRSDIPAEHRSRFWYTYKHNGKIREAMKSRISNPGDPDYWEPSRPLVGSGMQKLPGKQRHPQIEKESRYLNFKTLINAFDNCFFFTPKRTLVDYGKRATWQRFLATLSRKLRRNPRVQDYLRIRSRKLKTVLDTGGVEKVGKYALNEPFRSLTDRELGAINKIIGKRYIGGKTIRHRFFGEWGTTIAFSTAERNYTDAFAGSGEGAVVRLVLELEAAEPGSLVLLDEPETSLHPGAQEQMLAFILNQIRTKKLQVLISTHSPTIVDLLPREAIKVFTLNDSGLVDVAAGLSAHEAFHYIGHRYDADINIIVEDSLAKAVVDAAIDSLGPAIRKRFRVSFGAGGVSAMKKHFPLYSTWPSKPYTIFDGDVRPKPGASGTLHVDPQEIRRSDLTSSRLKDIAERQAGQRIDFPKDSQMSDDALCDTYINYLDYFHKRVDYLPFATPEDAIWSDAACANLVSTGILDQEKAEEVIKEISNEIDIKSKYNILSKATGGDIHNLHNMFLKRFSQGEKPEWSLLVDFITRINNLHV